MATKKAKKQKSIAVRVGMNLIVVSQRFKPASKRIKRRSEEKRQNSRGK